MLYTQRPSARELLRHRFVRSARKSSRLLERIRLEWKAIDYQTFLAFIVMFCLDCSAMYVGLLVWYSLAFGFSLKRRQNGAVKGECQIAGTG